jgi:hypothetical protein
VKWVITSDEELLVIPKYVNGEEIAHAVISNKPVLAAGEADVAGQSGGYFGLEITEHSGHFVTPTGRMDWARYIWARHGIEFPTKR